MKRSKSANLHLLSGKIMKEAVQQSVFKQLNNNKVMRNRQRAFVQNRSCQSSLIYFFAEITDLVGAERNRGNIF